MELFHTSPVEITEINKHGRFGEFLFFSPKVYVMTASQYVTYKIDINEESLIDASDLFYHDDAHKLADLCAELANDLGVDVEVAEELISESESIWDLDLDLDPSDIAEKSWDIQRYTARAAKELGFAGVRVTDEQGPAIMIDMLGKEGELINVE